MNAGSLHPSDLALDRGGPEVQVHLAACERCRGRAEAASRALATFAEKVYPATWPLVRARLQGTRPRGRWTLWVGIPALAAIGVLLLFIRPRPAPEVSGPPGGEARYDGLKGRSAIFPPGIEIHVKRASARFVLTPGQKVRAGDALRFVYRGEEARRLELRIRNPHGQEVPFYPLSGHTPLVEPGEPLPGSALVDESPGPEEVVVRVSTEAFNVGDPLPATRIRLDKE